MSICFVIYSFIILLNRKFNGKHKKIKSNHLFQILPLKLPLGSCKQPLNRQYYKRINNKTNSPIVRRESGALLILDKNCLKVKLTQLSCIYYLFKIFIHGGLSFT